MGVRFSREPYTVTYWKDGEKKTIRRRPPEKLHDIMPEDTVTITRKKGDDFDKGDTVTVKNIQNRSPNVLQVTNEEGLTSFIDYYDVNLEKKNYLPPGVEYNDLPINNKYLLWP